jgi:hypothetical protein
MDGWGIPHVQGDEIQLADGQRARITNVNYETNLITVDRILKWSLNQGISLAYQGSAPDLGAYEFEPGLELHGAQGDQAIYLSWTINVSLPVTTTWTITYDGPAGVPPSPISGLAKPTRAYTLTGLTNYQWYTVTLTTDPTMLTGTVRVMPTDHLIHLPLVTNTDE